MREELVNPGAHTRVIDLTHLNLNNVQNWYAPAGFISGNARLIRIEHLDSVGENLMEDYARRRSERVNDE